MAVNSVSPLRTVDDYLASQAEAEVNRTSTLGQNDFLKLMTTQLMNQDPLQPMENGDFLAQMAQFSTVNGITEMNASVQSMSESFTSQRLMQAGSLINKSALVEGNFADLTSDKGLRGAFVLERATDGTQVVIRNLQGEVVHTESLGIKFSGTHEYSDSQPLDTFCGSHQQSSPARRPPLLQLIPNFEVGFGARRGDQRKPQTEVLEPGRLARKHH